MGANVAIVPSWLTEIVPGTSVAPLVAVKVSVLIESGFIYLLNWSTIVVFVSTPVAALLGIIDVRAGTEKSTVPLVAKVEVAGVVMVLPLRSETPATVRV